MPHARIDRLEPFDKKKKEWRVVIETPQGSHNKYDFNTDLGVFELGGVLPEGMSFPYDFGFLPSTLGDDGDPLDVLLLMDEPSFVGCVVAARLIGVIEARQTETDGESDQNDRLLAIPCHAQNYWRVCSIHDLDPHRLEEIQQFFESYNWVRGKKFKVRGIRGPKRAEALARKGIKAYIKGAQQNG